MTNKPIINRLIGTDPEFIVVDIETGQPRSVEGFIDGKKKQPTDLGRGCGVEKDNVMGELTVPPSNTIEEFIEYMNYGKTKIDEILRPYGLKILSASSAKYDAKELDSDQARTFGCDPSYCIYTRNVSPRPSPEQVGNLRSAGFHIHIGADRLLDINEIELLIFYMDVCLGIPSIIIDLDEDRRKIYGNAGDFRFNHHVDGFTITEYRTLGASMHGSDEHIRYVFEQTDEAIKMFNNSEYANIDEIPYLKEVKDIIDTQNVEEAYKFTQKHGIKIISSIFEGHLVSTMVGQD